MNRICKYNQKKISRYGYEYNYPINRWQWMYYNLYGIGNTLNNMSKLYNIGRIVNGINGFKH